MNFFLSILLCIAMAFGRTGELPAEPEAATERTLRNLHFAIDGEALELAPEIRAAAALGATRFVARFGVERGSRRENPRNLRALGFSLP